MRRFLSVLATTSVAIAAFASPALAQQTSLAGTSPVNQCAYRGASAAADAPY